jgi:hypothetical protein
MKKLEMLKTGVKVVVTLGVGAIISNVAKCTTPRDTGKIMKLCIGLGSIVLGGIVTDKAGEYTDKTIDEAVGDVKEMVENGDLS